MYYVVFALLYLVSLLPFFVIYRISDLIAFIMHSVLGYRKKVVMQNLDIAFPEKTVAEKKKIARRFYRNLTDTFLETIKLMSLSDHAFRKRVEMNFTDIIVEIEKGRNIQWHVGHQFNWEYAWRIACIQFTIPLYGVYMKIKSPIVERLFIRLRSARGGRLVAAHEFRAKANSIFQEQYGIGLVADQNPGVPANAYWLHFFNRPAPFATGPDKGAIKNQAAVIFVQFKKLKRGHYQYIPHVVTSNGSEFEEGELTRMYRDFLEKNIREEPDNYLWSHRRWKWPYQESYQKQWIDKNPPNV